MNIQFQFHGCLYTADLKKKDEKKIEVDLDGIDLEKQFGHTLPFYVEGKEVGFEILNKCHSELYELNSTISKAISEQCAEIL